MQPLTDNEIKAIGLHENPLLTKFINLRLQESVEPVREGTPKGELIGFSREKVIASILKGVSILNMKQIADAVRKSRSVVRFWNSQDEAFKDRAKQEKALFKKSIQSETNIIKAESKDLTFAHNFLFENLQLYQNDIAHSLKSYADVALPKLNAILTPLHLNAMIESAKNQLEVLQKEIAAASKKKDTEKVNQLISMKLPQVTNRLQLYTRLADLSQKHKA